MNNVEENPKQYIPDLHTLRVELARDFHTLKNTVINNGNVINSSKGVEFSLIHLMRSRMWLKETIRAIESAEASRPVTMVDDDKFLDSVDGAKFETIQGVQGWIKLYIAEINTVITRIEGIWLNLNDNTFSNMFLEQAHIALVEVKMWMEYELQNQKVPQETHASQD